MHDNRNQNGRFEPIHEAHAIEQVLFALQFAKPVDDATFAKVRDEANKFKDGLPGRADIQSFALSIGAPVPAGAISSGPPAGIVFNKSRPDGTIENELRLDRSSVTFRTTSYTRWDAIWAVARSYFDAIIPIYVEKADILGIGLNFVDRFPWVGAITECRPRLLLREASKYLCPHLFDTQDLWHSHTGAFLRIDNATKRLLNINAECVDEIRPDGLRRVVAITTGLTDFMNQPGFTASNITAANAGEFLNARMNQLHAFSKEVFGNVINNEMSKRIALID